MTRAIATAGVLFALVVGQFFVVSYFERRGYCVARYACAEEYRSLIEEGGGR